MEDLPSKRKTSIRVFVKTLLPVFSTVIALALYRLVFEGFQYWFAAGMTMTAGIVSYLLFTFLTALVVRQEIRDTKVDQD